MSVNVSPATRGSAGGCHLPALARPCSPCICGAHQPEEWQPGEQEECFSLPVPPWCTEGRWVPGISWRLRLFVGHPTKGHSCH